MRTGIATVSISGNLSEKLEAITAAGFDGIEIFEQDFLADAGSPREVGQRVRDYGLEIILFQPFRDFEGLPTALRRKAFDRAERKFDLMQELGTDLLLVCSSINPHAYGGIDRAADDFAELGERAAARKLRVGYEALAWGRHVNDHRDAWEVVRRANRPNIGLALDSFHTLARRIDPKTIRRIPGDRIFCVQLADAPAIEMDLLYCSRHFRCMPGEGNLPVLDFMRAVAATGYNGPISLEIFYDQIRSGRPKSLSRDGHRSLVYVMDQVRRAEPKAPLGFPDIPPRIDIEGVEYVEFTSTTEKAHQITKILGTMGFAHVGTHKSKSMELWQQNAIKIVVNTETSGFANSVYLIHGTSVCDIGFRVADTTATVTRADAMEAYPFAQPIGPGELEIPAFRSVGGSVMHFIDNSRELSDIWKNEFVQTDLPSDKGATLVRIDHLGATMDYDEMMSWSLFYSSIFNVEKTPIVEVIGLDGLYQSQAIETHDKNLRWSLSSAASQRTIETQSLADRLGSTTQHIAFVTNDIFASAECMAANGFVALSISLNYYEDLAARYDLSADLLNRMKAANVLYDKSENGEFFHYYSLPYGDGMFFEIVERKNGYDGYGIANAPFRIAAQKRFLRSKGNLGK